MDEAKLQEIEARATAIHAEMTHTRARCDDCDMINPPTDDRGCHDECPSAGGNARLWHAMVTRDGTKLEGVAGLCEIAGHMTALVAEVRRLTAALDAARREGAEGMRAAAVAMIGRRITAWDDDADECGDEDAATRWEEATAIRDAIRALPLDAPGGGS